MADLTEQSFSARLAEGRIGGTRAQRIADAPLPLWSPSDPDRPIAWRNGRIVALGEFRRHVTALASGLPNAAAMVNLCEDRYHFLVGYCAALSRAQTVLLPPSRAQQVVEELQSAHGDAYRCDDAMLGTAIAEPTGTAPPPLSEQVAARHVAMIAFTSGSTGHPKRHPKLWGGIAGSNACNAAAMRAALRWPCEPTDARGAVPWIVATVPPQHMYGMELTVLLPLIGGMAVHSAKPLFPADIARALEEVPEPRVLVSTPLHLRTLIESGQPFPHVALVVSATAPIDAQLARAVERKAGGRFLEMFGSTETCVFATRRTAVERAWTAYPGVTLQPLEEGTRVDAPWFAEPTLLQDLVEATADNRFVVRGRNTDMVEVAGKRASLADLTRRLLAIEGVRDAVVFQPEARTVATIRRLAALVVAPGLTASAIRERLAPGIDPAFLPRPLVIVDALPRNELGKLPRAELMEVLRNGSAEQPPKASKDTAPG